MKRLILTCLITIFSLTIAHTQVINLSPRQDSTTLYEKLYLHTDREIYSPGDDIWFKSYLVGGINHQLIPGFKNVYVQLIAEDGEIIDNRLMLSVNGVSNNDFHLPDTIPEGSYTIRAYTKYLQNFGEESLFHKRIRIAKASETPDVSNKNETGNKIDVSFLPEGGSLVLNAANHIAFKAIDETGKGIEVSGEIVDETGETVTTFKSRYKGMGSFMMMPQEGKTYYAKLDDYPDFSYRFENVQPDGIALHYETQGSNMVFTLSRNIKETGAKNLIMVVWYKNQKVFSEDIEITEFQYPVEIYKGFFPEGISKITLYDEQQNILAERLIFVSNESEKTLDITTDKNEYGTREKAILNIESILDYNDTIQNTLSVAIVNEDYFDAGGNSQTIESYLLLDSELNGPLESPASYFIDDEEITAKEKLDLVMMVNGWRRYYWDELNKYDWQNLPHWDDAGLTVQGKVTTLFGGKPVEGGIVKMGPFSGLFLILRDTTNETGHYQFNRLFLKDSATIMINAENRRGNSSVEITDETPPVYDSKVSTTQTNKLNLNVSLPERFYRASYFKQKAETEFELEHGSILIKDVDVIEKRLEPTPYTRRTFGYPDRTMKVTENDWHFNNIYEYFEMHPVGGMVVSDEVITIRGNNPVILVDGLKPYMNLKYMPMADIDAIDIMKSSYFSAFLGSEGGGNRFSGNRGIISIITRTGFGAVNNEFERIIHGRITPEFTGFRQAREFYAPKYPLAEQDSIPPEQPDQRPTLYWNPYVILENGQTELEFSTSDMLGTYRIIAEGISSGGRACYGSSIFDVGVSGK